MHFFALKRDRLEQTNKNTKKQFVSLNDFRDVS